MKVVLLKNIPRLGFAGDVKEVKDGYALNYLLPKKMAALPGEVNIARLKKINKRSSGREILLENKEKILAKLNKLSLEISAEANSQGRLYASVDKKIIVKALEERGIKVSPHSMKPAHLKEIGEQNVELALDQNLTARVKVIIKKK